MQGESSKCNVRQGKVRFFRSRVLRGALGPTCRWERLGAGGVAGLRLRLGAWVGD